MIRRFPVAIQLNLLVLAWLNSHVIAGLTVDEQLEQLKINYMKMEQILAAKDSRSESLEQKFQHQTRFKEETEAKETRFQAQVDELKVKVTGLEAQLHRQESIITTLQNLTPKIANDIQSKLINGMPSSCAELRLKGHIWSGLYSIMGSNMVETVYCDFSKALDDPGLQKWIGYTDVKSAPVYFYVQKETEFDRTNTPIPFERVLNNVGNAMNVDTGIFTAPVTGTYFFALSGMARFGYPDSSTTRREIAIALYKNGNEIGLALADEVGHVDQFGTYDMESTLNLKSGDQVWMAIKYKSPYTYVFDNFQHHNHFTGWLLQQDFENSV